MKNKSLLATFLTSALRGFKKDASFLSRAVVVLFLLWVLIIAVSISYFYTNQELLIFKFPSKEVAENIQLPGLKTENFEFQSSNGHKHTGWYLKKENSTKNLLYFYGANENVKSSIDRLKWLASFSKCSLIICDYPGYGKSEGKPSEKKFDEYIDSLKKTLNEKGIVGNKKLIVWGYNIGGYMALKFNQNSNLECLILESTFSSIEKLTVDQFPFLYLVPFNVMSRNKFDNLSLIENVKNPIILIHSENDYSIPILHAQRLFNHSSKIKGFIKTQNSHKITFPNDLNEYKTALRKHLPNWFY